MPVFLPGLGAYVRWPAMGVTRQTRAEVSLAGPLAGLLGAVLCAVMWKTGSGSVWAALARTSGWLNILNLTPVLIFDGGQAAHALNRAERFAVLVVCLLLWLYVHNVVLLIVAAGMVYRLTTKDLPPMGSTRVAAYFIGVLAGLALVVRFIPGQMFAPR
jgi:Zn-dependent protease